MVINKSDISLLLIGLITFIGSLFFYAVSADAEIYQYYKDGVICFTDDISKVPEKQLPSVKPMREIVSSPEIENRQNSDQSDKEIFEENVMKNSKAEKIQDGEAEQLDEIRKKLNREFEGLKKRKAELNAALENENSPRQLKIYNQLIKKLNEDSMQYLQKKERYEKRLADHKSRRAQP